MANRPETQCRNREFYIEHDKIPLHAKLDYPDGGVKEDGCPLVILLHGYTGHMEEVHICALAKAMNEHGFAVLRIELYGHGLSGGSFHDHTILKWMSEMMTVIDYARTLDFVTGIYLAGHSQGGLVTALAGVMKQDVLRALLLLSPALMIPDEARKGIVLGTEFDPYHIPDTLQMEDGRLLGGNYIRAAQTVEVDSVLKRCRIPVLIVHGDEDESVPVQCAVDAEHICECAELAIIPGDTHCYDRHLDQAAEAVVAYLDKMES